MVCERKKQLPLVKNIRKWTSLGVFSSCVVIKYIGYYSYKIENLNPSPFTHVTFLKDNIHKKKLYVAAKVYETTE